MTESGESDPETPKQMQQNEPNPTGEGGDRDAEAGEEALVEDLESDRARAGGDSPAQGLQGD